jgi:hypothetical protein
VASSGWQPKGSKVVDMILFIQVQRKIKYIIILFHIGAMVTLHIFLAKGGHNQQVKIVRTVCEPINDVSHLHFFDCLVSLY